MTPYKIVNVAALRKSISDYANWVTFRGGRIWIAKRGKLIGAVVSMDEVDKLEAFEKRSLSDQRRRLEAEYVKWKRLKAAGHLVREWRWEEAMLDEESFAARIDAQDQIAQEKNWIDPENAPQGNDIDALAYREWKIRNGL